MSTHWGNILVLHLHVKRMLSAPVYRAQRKLLLQSNCTPYTMKIILNDSKSSSTMTQSRICVFHFRSVLLVSGKAHSNNEIETLRTTGTGVCVGRCESSALIDSTHHMLMFIFNVDPLIYRPLQHYSPRKFTLLWPAILQYMAGRIVTMRKSGSAA